MFKYLLETVRDLRAIKEALNKLAQGDPAVGLAACRRGDAIGRIARLLRDISDVVQKGRQAEEHLRTQLTVKEAMLDSIPFAVLAERNGVILACNGRMEALFGYLPGELQGLHSRVLFGGDYAFSAAVGGLDAKHPGCPSVYESVMYRKNGETFTAIMAAHDLPAAASDNACRTWLCEVSGRTEPAGLKSGLGMAGKEATAFDLEGALIGVASALSSRAVEKGLELVLDISAELPTQVLGDPFALGQVINHLAHNAIRYSSHGEIVVSADVAHRQGRSLQLRFNVCDQGIGLAADEVARLNGYFTKPGAVPSVGTGLGIAKQLVDSMGGRLGVASQPGRGSNFHFAIDLSCVGNPEARTLAYARRLSDFAGQPVMVIDDNPSCRRVAGSMLKGLGFRPELFESGRAALAWLAGHEAPRYLFVCADWLMPELDGLEFGRCLRACYGPACPPLLLMAPFGSTAELIDAGGEFAGVVAKPLSLGQLFARIATLLDVAGPSAVEVPAAAERQESSLLRNKRILVVGVPELERDALTDFLRQCGMHVQGAANGLEALQAVREQPPDCVLMECDMPLLDGYEVTKRLRALGYSNLPVIAMTGHGRAIDGAICLAAGMSGMLSRPLDLSALVATLCNCMAPTAALQGRDGEVLPPLPPGLDVECGLKRLRGKTSLFLKALRMFRDSRGRQFQITLKAAVTSRDWKTSERLAHNLKDTAATIGANEVSAAAARLEAAIRLGAYGEAQLLLAMVTDKLQVIVKGLAHIG